MTQPARPRRSVLFIPGANAKAIEKAAVLAADVLVFDLEDSVAPEAKPAARQAVAAALMSGQFGKRELVVRINGLNTEWAEADLASIASAKPAAVLAPKVETAAQVRELEAARRVVGLDSALWIMVETPRAILNLAELATAARTTRLTCFVLGLNDLAKAARARLAKGRAPFQAALALSVYAARAEGLTVIDGVYNDIADAAGFEEECRQGRDLGFDGKSLIHPDQIAACNAVFAPTTEELARARAVIAAFAAPENIGKGVIKVDRKMAELLHLEEANRLIAVADAIAGL